MLYVVWSPGQPPRFSERGELLNFSVYDAPNAQVAVSMFLYEQNGAGPLDAGNYQVVVASWGTVNGTLVTGLQGMVRLAGPCIYTVTTVADLQWDLTMKFPQE